METEILDIQEDFDGMLYNIGIGNDNLLRIARWISHLTLSIPLLSLDLSVRLIYVTICTQMVLVYRLYSLTYRRYFFIILNSIIMHNYVLKQGS